MCLVEQNGTAETVYQALSKHNTKIYFYFCQGHLSLIKDFVCKQCGNIFLKVQKLEQHEGRCDSTVKCKYPGGLELASNGVTVADELSLVNFKYKLTPNKCNMESKKSLEKTVPIHYSVGSNIPGATDICHFASVYPKKLINHSAQILPVFFSSERASTLECFEDVVTAIGLACELYSQQQQNNDNHDMDLMLGDDIEEVETDLMKQLSDLQQKLEDCCKELAILGFNSLSYDIN